MKLPLPIPSRLIVVTFLLSAWLSLPLVATNLRYLYREDDGHHINHTIEMAQQHTLNPNYFNKPALHFYLRMPFVYAGVAIETLRGRMADIREIRTRDPYGAGGYAFTPSHPMIIAWLRVVSVLCNALLAALVVVALMRLGQGPFISLIGGSLTMLSPEALNNSWIVGVDTLMALGCLACGVYGMTALSSFSRRKLLVCGLLAGLSCAAKYNAAPVAIIPVLVWWFRDRSATGLWLAGAATVSGFLLGAPYTIISFDQFWKGVSYEAWHYGVAGHEGNDGMRGLPQLIFYARWLVSDGIGWIGALLALLGLAGLFQRNRHMAYLLLAFPLAYTTFMVCQKVNFTRNMVAVIPFVAIFAACGLQEIRARMIRPHVRQIVTFACALAAIIPLAYASARIIAQSISQPESRAVARQWLESERTPLKDVALAGPLQLSPHLFNLPGVDAFNPQTTTLSELAQVGYTYALVPSELQHSEPLLFREARSIPGELQPQRIVQNPAISILSLDETKIRDQLSPSAEVLRSRVEGGNIKAECPSTPDDHCWISKRISRIEIQSMPSPLTLSVLSPWPHQTIELTTPDGRVVGTMTLSEPGVWKDVSISPSITHNATTTLILTLSDVHSPASRGISQDNRRLGIALMRYKARI